MSEPVGSPLAETAHAALAALVAAACRGDAAAVSSRTRDALAAGAPTAAVREALRMIHLFAGFPRALDALAAAAPSLPPAASESPDDRAAFVSRGRALFGRVYGADAARVLAKIESLDPAVAAWVIEDAYGRVLTRGVLSPADRERLAVAMLAAQGLRNQLAGHVRGAVLCGAMAAQVETSLAAAAPWISAEDLAAARAALT